MIFSWIGLVGAIIIALNLVYLMTFALAGRLRKSKKSPEVDDHFSKFLVMVPAYKEDRVVAESVTQLLNQEYPAEKYDIAVIADSISQKVLDWLKTLPIHVVEVSFEQSTKAKALNQGLDVLPQDYDCVTVLDADNVVESDYLRKLNGWFVEGYSGVQARRVAKNNNSSVAALDGLNEQINNHIFRKGHAALGVSCALIGSGMAFRYDVFRFGMKDIYDAIGEDKVLELKLLSEGVRVAYAEDILVFDEKVQDSATFQKQRSRWLTTQFDHIVEGVKLIPTALKIKSSDLGLKIVNAFILPRTFILMLLMLRFGLEVVLPSQRLWFWLTLFGLFVATMLVSMPRKFWTIKTVKAFLSLPKLVLNMLGAFVRSRIKPGGFAHTPHSYQANSSENAH